MKIVYVQTYPAYHDFGDSQKWLHLNNRDKWMPALTKQAGHECELWCGAETTEVHQHKDTSLPDITIRFFKTDSLNGKSKKHISTEMVDFARTSDTYFFVLKGVDGGIGKHLLRNFIIPEKKPFAFVIGGTVYSKFVKHATAVLYETEFQKKMLQNPGFRFWRKVVNKKSLIKLPKSIDCDIFRPYPATEKKYDVISTGRLISYYKNYDALRALSKKLRVGFIGGGPELERFKKEMPDIDWIGHIPNQKVPEFLASGSVFFYTGLRDYFPRVIPEAAACGLPVVAFGDVIKRDVLPAEIGLRVTKNNYIEQILNLCNDENRVKQMSADARAYATEHWNKSSANDAIQRMIQLAVR